MNPWKTLKNKCWFAYVCHSSDLDVFRKNNEMCVPRRVSTFEYSVLMEVPKNLEPLESQRPIQKSPKQAYKSLKKESRRSFKES